MVLFKRKPVRYLSPPTIEDEETEVWIIPQTEEIFVEYEAYLARLDFYKQTRFICQITGHSGLNFFEALKSELAGAQEVEDAFPEPLKGPVLRRVQFQIISRIDNLVDVIFEEFKTDYYPGEPVTVHVVTGERLTGVVREKTRFGAKVLPNGEMSPAFSRYFVSLDSRPLEEAVVDDAHIYRDRKIFTKQVLRSFIKKTVTREAWTGAPWLVRPEVAARYHIDTRVPAHLRHENKIAHRREHQANKKTVPPPEYEGMVNNFPAKGLPELKPKNQKGGKGTQGPKQQKIQFLHPINHQQPPPPGMNPSQYIHPPFQMQVHPYQATGILPPMAPLPPGYGYHNSPYAFPPPHQQQPPHQQTSYSPQPLPPPPPPPPVKYPIDDLEVPIRPGGAIRPQLKYFSEDTPVRVEDHLGQDSGIFMATVGSLLETWNTLNVYCEVFKLDSFTFDDFVEALRFQSDDTECELLVECHCAALNLLVESEADGGKILVQLPDMEIVTEDDDASDTDGSGEVEPTPEPEPKPEARATRSSLARAEAEALKANANRMTPEETTQHRGADFQAAYDWILKLQKREFKNGGWEMIMIGLLHQLSKDQRHQKSCDELLRRLAPMDQDPTQETARRQYASLDINSRVKALQILCLLTIETKAIRAFMDEGAETMTTYRKQKITWQRERKTALEEMRVLNEERKILLPANTIPSPEPESREEMENAKMNGVHQNGHENQENEEDEAMDTDDSPRPSRALRGGNDRAAERAAKKKREEERKAKAEAAAKLPKQSKQFLKILKDIQKKKEQVEKCEHEIAIIDNDLREADCPRTRVLGKDRFWNLYYWFERNGMPYAGLPDSSTADAEYANARIWVQGPDDIEREGYIDMKQEWQREYVAKFDCTVPQRKHAEEGHTSVFNAGQWGYIDEPGDVDKLIEWLDPRGFNELKLIKELKLYRTTIKERMDSRKRFLEEAEPKAEEAGKRMSTRKQHQPNETGQRFLRWHNTMAIHANGHMHSEQPKPRRPPANKRKVVFEERETRSEKKAKESKTSGR